MYYSQPKYVEELRVFCSLVDQERVENMLNHIIY